jgi:hypothetical protein
MQNHIPLPLPSINIDTTVPLSHLNARGLSSPTSTTPLTPGFSPSQPGYSSSPSLMAVTPPTPATTLGHTHDAFTAFSPSTPVSPFGVQHPPPWPIPKPVRPSLASFQCEPDQSLNHRVHLRSQSVSFLLANFNEVPWCHRSDTSHTPRATGVAMSMKSTWSNQSTSTCTNLMKKGFRSRTQCMVASYALYHATNLCFKSAGPLSQFALT